MDEPLAALRETCRVLRPPGRVALSVWGEPARNPWTTIDADVCARLGYVAPASPTEAGQMFSLADAGRLGKVVEMSGLAVSRIETVRVAWSYASVEDYVDIEIDRPGRRGDFFRALSQAERSFAMSLAAERLEPFRADTGYVVPGESLNLLALRLSACY